MAEPHPSTGAKITHGRHCPCAACAREDWTKISAPCGMHGEGCPAVYAPISSGAYEHERETLMIAASEAW